ncbi:MAG: hypothetical protein ACR2KQ_00775 [Actinomycetota bacterium]
MSTQFSTEIGRMRRNEMVTRGLSYQRVEAARRAAAARDLNDRPSADRPPGRSVRRHRARRGPVLATLVMVLLFGFSSAAVANPTESGGSVDSLLRGTRMTSAPLEAVTTVDITPIVVSLVVGLIVFGFLRTLGRLGSARA